VIEKVMSHLDPPLRDQNWETTIYFWYFPKREKKKTLNAENPDKKRFTLCFAFLHIKHLFTPSTPGYFQGSFQEAPLEQYQKHGLSADN